MRVKKAFSLIEIIVVIIIVGVLFSLIFNNYIDRQKDSKLLKINDIPNYVSNLSIREDTTFYVYGKKCDNGALFLNEKFYMKLPTFGFNQDSRTYNRDKNNQIKKIYFQEIRVAKKRRKVCFKLEFEGGRFFDKLIVSLLGKYYIFSPFYQKVESFNSLDEAKKAYRLKYLQLTNIDGYYSE